MAHMSAFLPHVLQYVPSCPKIVAIHQIKAAAIEFCERTSCWRAISSATLAGQGQALVAPAGATIHLIEEATLDGQPLEPVQFTDISPDELSGEVLLGNPKYITQIEPGKVQIYPFTPGGILRVSAFIKPRSDAAYNTVPNDPLHDAYAVVPDFLLEQDAEAIAFGAIARLKMMPRQRFSEPDGAMFYEQKFSMACDARFGRSMKGQQRAKIRTIPHWL